MLLNETEDPLKSSKFWNIFVQFSHILIDHKVVFGMGYTIASAVYVSGMGTNDVAAVGTLVGPVVTAAGAGVGAIAGDVAGFIYGLSQAIA